MIKGLIIFIYLILILPNGAMAVGSDFTIRTLVGDDAIPPTTPTLLSAVPIATSQIDLSWSVSTDNFSMDGYVLLRDGVPIATTTLTSYSDIDLVPDTLYSYEVYAFDSYLNISTTSNSLSTTTLSIPPTPVPSDDDEEDINNVSAAKTIVLREFNIMTSENTAFFNWKTYGLSRFTLWWGRTDEYNDGYINSSVYRSVQNTRIDNLLPNTNYLYKLEGHTVSGQTVVLKKGQFHTDVKKNVLPPPNVLRLEARVVGEDNVDLSWQLPTGIKVKNIRVVSSPFNYPADLNDGEVVYEGQESSVFDKGALSKDKIKYYTVFVIDEFDNISSGALVSVNKNETTNQDKPEDIHDDLVIDEKYISGDMSLHDFDSNNINIIQGDNSYTFISDRINLSYKKPFTIKIPYESLPRHLKSIVVTILDPTDNRRDYSFLLRINKAGTSYEATIAPLNVLGSSRLQVEIFDFESQLIGSYKKQIDFSVLDNVPIEELEVVFPDKVIMTTKNIATTLLILSGILLLFFLRKLIIKS